MVSDSPGLMDFAIGLVNLVVNLPDGQVIFFEEFEKQKNCEINSAVQKAFGLVEMTSGLVNVSFSCRNDFLCNLVLLIQKLQLYRFPMLTLQCIEQNVVTSLSYLPGLHHSTAWSVREWRGSQDQHHPTRHKKKLLSLNLSEIFVLSWREKLDISTIDHSRKYHNIP